MLLITACAFVGLFCAALAVYTAEGFTLRLPLFLATQIAVVAAPVGFGLIQLARAFEAPGRPALATAAPAAAGLALLSLWGYGGQFPVIVVGLLAALVVHLAIQPRAIVVLALAMIALITWLTSVQLANYIVLKHVVHRLQDAVLWGMDREIYSIFVPVESMSAFFPVVRSPFLNRVLENAYLTLAVQPMAVILFHLENQRLLCRFLVSGVTCHAAALVFFFVFPAVGPTLYQPHSFDPAFSESLTGRAISSMLVDLHAVRDGHQPVTGFGYFVALPSLHAAIATLCQVAVRGRAMFWLLLPMNLVMFVSTFLLGQHYIVDPIAGVVLGWAAWQLVGRTGLGRDEPVRRV